MGVKHSGCPITHTVFGLCINKLEEIVKNATKEEELDDPKLIHKLIFILPYADVV
mgnify:CR=1 FL=1